MKRISVVAGCIIFATALAQGQLVPGALALSTRFGGDAAVGGAYALSANKRINFSVGFDSAIPDSGTSRSSFAIQTGMWFYRPAVENVSFFYGGAIEFKSTSGVRRAGDLGLAVQAGAEYSVARRFSVGTFVGLSLWTGDTSANGNKGSKWGIANTGVLLTWWFL